MNDEPSGVSSDTSASWTDEPPNIVEVYMVNPCHSKLVMVPLKEAMVALQSVKVTFPKFAKSEILWPTVGLSTIHSAVSWLELYVKVLWKDWLTVVSVMLMTHWFEVAFASWIEACI